MIVCGINPDTPTAATLLPSVRHVPDALHTHLMCVLLSFLASKTHNTTHSTLDGQQASTAVLTRSPAEASISANARFTTLLVGNHPQVCPHAYACIPHTWQSFNPQEHPSVRLLQSPRDALRIVPQSFQVGQHTDVILVGYTFKVAVCVRSQIYVFQP